jgi:elongation factor Ts
MITTEMIKELREKTGAPIMTCKNILYEVNGDFDRALGVLKEASAALAIKKAERVTAEGLIGAYVAKNGKTGALVEVNCETDFVASNKEFVKLTDSIARQVAVSSSEDIESLLCERFLDDSYNYLGVDKNATMPSVKEIITAFVAKFGENINIGGFAKLSTGQGTIRSYVHNGGKIGALAEISCSKTDGYFNEHFEGVAKEIAMQIVATNPMFLDRESANLDTIDEEVLSHRNKAIAEGKPANIVDKIVAGKMEKFYKTNCLLEQPWIKNEDISIADFLTSTPEKQNLGIRVVKFARLERATGLSCAQGHP